MSTTVQHIVMVSELLPIITGALFQIASVQTRPPVGLWEIKMCVSYRWQICVTLMRKNLTGSDLYAPQLYSRFIL